MILQSLDGQITNQYKYWDILNDYGKKKNCD